MRAKQTGMSMWSLLFWMLIIASVITLTVKLVPIYIDHYAVRSAVQEVLKEKNLAELSEDEIMQRLEKRLQVNNIRDFKDDYVTITIENGKVMIDLDYEVRTHMVKNIDALVYFKEQYSSDQP
ncbi:DUF4845 domain-containing protein [Hahella sp. SMD15-11]|uniref:DUF4845 domain-containing protein n=1 Tax=Thermohahella caldifontis TaxID=3142973 RepID=A0AB39V0U9_9GAMM